MDGARAGARARCMAESPPFRHARTEVEDKDEMGREMSKMPLARYYLDGRTQTSTYTKSLTFGSHEK
jgi:hypothetical protein